MSESQNTEKQRVSVRNCTEELLAALKCRLDKQSELVLPSLKKVKSRELCAALTEIVDGYAGFENEVSARLGIIDECGVKEMLSHFASKISVEMNTIIDDSDAQIVQMLIESVTVSVTDIIRLVRDFENSNCSESALSLAREVVSFQEGAAERLKSYL